MARFPCNATSVRIRNGRPAERFFASMSADKDHPLLEQVEHGLEQAGLVEHVAVHDRSGWHRVWRFTRLGLLVLFLLLVIAVAAVWIWRKPIADDYIRDELERRGVTATYQLDRVGFRTQQVSNLVIGDPANPDLSVRRASHPAQSAVERQLQSLSRRGARRAAQGAAWSATRSAGARSTSCCRRRRASRSRCQT